MCTAKSKQSPMNLRLRAGTSSIKCNVCHFSGVSRCIDGADRYVDSCNACATRSVLGSAQPAGNDRFESPYYVEIANEAVQMHGGIGMTDEADPGLYMKRARVQEALYGSASWHRDRYASLNKY